MKMLARIRGVQLRKRRSIKRSSNNIFRILSTLIIPLTLGLFTTAITIFQHISSKNERREDLKDAMNRRTEDIQIFEQRRIEDRNETRIQREQEWTIALMRQDAQNNVTLNRYQDIALKDYIKEINNLIKENNGSLISNEMIRVLAHVKTLNVLRQLDGYRQIHVIRFLNEIAKITKTSETFSLIMHTAELTNVNFQYFTWTHYITNLTFFQLYLRNCTFMDLTCIEHINFTLTRFDRVKFSPDMIKDVDLSLTRHSEVIFVNTIILNSNFSSVKIRHSKFVNTAFQNVNFSSAWLLNINTSNVTFNQSNFSFSKFKRINFSNTKFINMNFSFVHLAGGLCYFCASQMIHSIFIGCNCQMADFSYANLLSSVFLNANLKNVSFQSANLTQVNFSGANLRNVDFTNTTISDSQLQNARSIHNAKLPNGTFGQDRNLIENGYAHCNISNAIPWHLQNGHILIMISEEDPNNCRFVLQPKLMNTIMSQSISLIHIWNSNHWTDSKIELQFRRSNGITVELYGQQQNGTILEKIISNPNVDKIILNLKDGMEELKVIVRFDAQFNQPYVWCDDIELFIDYDILEKADDLYFNQ